MKNSKLNFQDCIDILNNVEKENRTVQVWNDTRDVLKDDCDAVAINDLDSSGFIHEWMGKNIVQNGNE